MSSCQVTTTEVAPGAMPKFATKSILTISQSAQKKIAQISNDVFMQTGLMPLGLRIAVVRGGCSGVAYSFSVANELIPGDEIVKFEYQGKDKSYSFAVHIAPSAIIYVINSEMDYISSISSSKFVFRNDRTEGRCGCGQSFSAS